MPTDARRPRHVAATLRELLYARRLTVSRAAKVLGVHRVTLSRFLNERTGLSTGMAVRFAQAFGLDLKTLMRLQSAYDRARARTRGRKFRTAAPSS